MKKIGIKRVLSIVLSMALIGGMLAGCGEKEKPTSTEDPTGGTSTEGTADASGKLVLYSTCNDEEYYMIVDAFEAKYPNIKIEVVQGGAGELKTRIEAESESPNGDVMFGGISFSDSIAYQNLWEEYVSPYDETLPEQFRNTTGQLTMKSVQIVNLLVNKELAADLGIEIKSLDDLLQPELKGKIIMADPTASSTAYRWLTNLLVVKGNGDYESDEAWEYVEKLIQNLDGVLSNSSSNAYKSVFDGEYVVGLTSESNSVAYLQEGYGDKVELVYPSEGTTAAPFGAAIIKNCNNMDNAKLFIDFLVSPEGQQIYADSTFRPVDSTLESGNEHLASMSEINLVDEDYAYVSEHQKEIQDRFNELLAKYN